MSDASRKDDRTALLAELALGTVGPEERAAREAWAAASPERAAELDGLRETLAALDAAGEPLAPSAALRRRVLSIPDPATRFEGFVGRMARLFDVPAERARAILAAIGTAGAGWEEPGIPGVRLFHFPGGPQVADADCGLVHVVQGSAFPAHAHRGDEWSLVLQGRAREDGGQVFEPGDLIHRPPGSRHAFHSIGEEPYVFAVVLYGGFHPEDPADRIP